MMAQIKKNKIRRTDNRASGTSRQFFVAAAFGIIGISLVFFGSAASNNADLPAVRSHGIYPGFGNTTGLALLERLEGEFGRKFHVAAANLDKNTWNSLGGSSYGLFENKTAMFRARTDVIPAITIPLRVSTTGRDAENKPNVVRQELQATANGANDEMYRRVANRMLASGRSKVILRIGHEPDIRFYPWSMRNGNEDVYKQAFCHVAGVFKAVAGNNFIVDYQGNGSFWEDYTSPRTGITAPYAEQGYPGNSCVDVIGIDVYDTQGWSGVKNKLDRTLAMAKKYGKPMSIPEWGLLRNGDNPTFIQNMYDWMNTTPTSGPGRLLYNIYFYRHSDANLNQYPNAKQRYDQLFGIPVTQFTANDAVWGQGAQNQPTQPAPTPASPAPTPTPTPTPSGPTTPATPAVPTPTPIAPISPVVSTPSTPSSDSADNNAATENGSSGATSTPTTNTPPQQSTAIAAPRSSGGAAIDVASNRARDDSFKVGVTIEDASSVGRVELRQAGSPAVIETREAAPFDFTLPPTTRNGNYTFEVVVYNQSGEQTGVATRTIQVRKPDIDRNGRVELADILGVITGWGTDNAEYDLDVDGSVDLDDIILIISSWSRD